MDDVSRGPTPLVRSSDDVILGVAAQVITWGIRRLRHASDGRPTRLAASSVDQYGRHEDGPTSRALRE